MGFGFNRRAFDLFLRHVGPTLRGAGWSLVVGLASYVVTPDLETAVRYAGGFLQLFGLWTVVMGVVDLGRQFKRRGVRAWAVEAVRLFKAGFSPTPEIRIPATGLDLDLQVHPATVRVGLPPGAPLHTRITRLEKELEVLRVDLKERHRAVRAEIAAVGKKRASEIQALKEESRETHRNLESVAVGGLDRQVVGLFWLFLGIILSSFAPELASLLRLLGM